MKILTTLHCKQQQRANGKRNKSRRRVFAKSRTRFTLLIGDDAVQLFRPIVNDNRVQQMHAFHATIANCLLSKIIVYYNDLQRP